MPRWLLLAALVAGCSGPYIQAVPNPPREGTVVAAPFDRAWDAVIDVFAENNLSIATIDKASGLIVTAPNLQIRREDAVEWAKCGVPNGFEDDPRMWSLPTRGEYNILVRSVTPTTSRVRVTVQWGAMHPAESRSAGCVTTGKYETSVEQLVRQKAER